MNIKDKIFYAINDKGRDSVTKVYLTILDEAYLEQYIVEEVGGELAGQTMLHGARKVLPTLLGKQVVWDSKEFKVE